MDCTYFLYVSSYCWTTITFKDDINFETGYDFLYIGRGTDTDKSKALFTYTGAIDNPDPIQIFGDTIWFRVTSDGSTNYYGVSIAWHVDGKCHF